MNNGILRSPQGDVSSKRTAGLVLIVVGIIAGYIGAGVGNMLLVDYSKWVVGFGSGLIGLGVFEHLK